MFMLNRDCPNCVYKYRSINLPGGEICRKCGLEGKNFKDIRREHITEYISKSAAIKACCGVCNQAECVASCDKVEAIKNLCDEKDVRIMRWIPVTERLPIPKDMFQVTEQTIVCFSNGGTMELTFDFDPDPKKDGKWPKTAFPVTRWMLMPDPPIREETTGA